MKNFYAKKRELFDTADTVYTVLLSPTICDYNLRFFDYYLQAKKSTFPYV